MKLHERYFHVAKVSNKLISQFMDAIPDNDLTFLEAIRIAADLQHRLIALALRQERHPDDPEQKADEA